MTGYCYDCNITSESIKDLFCSICGDRLVLYDENGIVRGPRDLIKELKLTEMESK